MKKRSLEPQGWSPEDETPGEEDYDAAVSSSHSFEETRIIGTLCRVLMICLVATATVSSCYVSFSYDSQFRSQVDTENEIFRASMTKNSPPPARKTLISIPAANVVEVDASKKNLSLIDSLAELNSLSPMKCPSGTVRINDTHIPKSHDTTNRKIPMIVFQTSRSRCMTPRLYKLTEMWRFEGWSYYFFDDAAMMRLLHEDFEDFPHMKLLTDRCIEYGTTKADLWRYIALWKFGGLYADLDAVPSKNFTKDTIQPEDDSLYVIESYHLLSQYFMSTSAHHPIIFYALHRALENLLVTKDTGKFNAALQTGPHALHYGFRMFMEDAGVAIEKPSLKPVKAGLYAGTDNRTCRAIGHGGRLQSNNYVIRESISQGHKINAYKSMNMTHNQEDKNHPNFQSCISSILHGRPKR